MMEDFDDSNIPVSGAIFTFGKSHLSELQQNQFWVNNDKVVDLSCGDDHTVLVAASGRVFVFGKNAHGQLGLGTSTTTSKPSCVKSLKQEKVKFVACGRSHTVFATESGHIYSCGSNTEGQLGLKGTGDIMTPQHVKIKPQRYKMLSCGADHTVALTENGKLLVWGCADEGKLGLGNEENKYKPTKLPVEELVTCISCGYYHTAFVTESGKLYTFGEMDYGKLGIDKSVEEALTPQLVSVPEKITQVSCGGSHTAALTDNGNVYTFGDGSNGQLGHGTTELQTSIPKCLTLGFKAVFVSCGENFTAIISDKGYLYTCGNGRQGRLAHGEDSFANLFKPRRVDGFHKFHVHKIACGGCHMVVSAQKSNDNELNRRLSNNNNNNILNDISPARSRRHQMLQNTSLNRTMPELSIQRLIPDKLNATLPHPHPVIRKRKKKAAKS